MNVRPFQSQGLTNPQAGVEVKHRKIPEGLRGHFKIQPLSGMAEDQFAVVFAGEQVNAGQTVHHAPPLGEAGAVAADRQGRVAANAVEGHSIEA